MIMKSKFLIMFVAIFSIAIINGCKKDEIKKSLIISNFEVKPESNITPTKVLVIYDAKVENYGEYTLYCQGAYNSLSESDAFNGGKGVYAGNYLKTDTIKLFYLHSGTFEISLVVDNGTTLSKNFTLTELK